MFDLRWVLALVGASAAVYLTRYSYNCFPNLRDFYIVIVAALSIALVASIIAPLYWPPPGHISWHHIRFARVDL